MPIIGMIFGGIFSAIKGFFGWRTEQAQTVQEAVKVLGDVTVSNAQREQAIASIISSESSSNYWLAACWRPLFMLIFMIIVLSFWFGYSPPQLNTPMPPMIGRIFDLIELGLGGYIPARTVEKIIAQLNLGSVLKTLINKNLLK